MIIIILVVILVVVVIAYIKARRVAQTGSAARPWCILASGWRRRRRWRRRMREVWGDSE